MEQKGGFLQQKRVESHSSKTMQQQTTMQVAGSRQHQEQHQKLSSVTTKQEVISSGTSSTELAPFGSRRTTAATVGGSQHQVTAAYQVQQQRQIQHFQQVQQIQQGEAYSVQTPTSPVPTQQMGRFQNGTPPIFEQIFKNARFAQGGNAVFEGKVSGSPKPKVSWTRRGAPLQNANKYGMTHDENTGKVSLVISLIGPGDEGEYTCTATNPFGEAVCTVYIQPEAQYRQWLQKEQQVSKVQQNTVQKTSLQESLIYTNGTIEEEFKVDTFEYRLVRDTEFREAKLKRVPGEPEEPLSSATTPGLPVGPPQIVQRPRSSKLLEGSDVVFQANVGGNPKPRISWFKNGARLKPSQRYKMTYDNQIATLNIHMAQPEDTGHYTMLAENQSGRVVNSAYLAVEAIGTDDESSYKPPNRDVAPTRPDAELEPETSKALAPTFVAVCGDKEVAEGKLARFDIRVSGRPYPDVAWYCNGRLLSDDAAHKILVNEAGNHSLMITAASRNDAGTCTCVAVNKSGQAKYEFNLAVIEKEVLVAPKFVERFTTTHVKEGEAIVLQCRAVGTPIPRITWQKDGVPLTSSSTHVIQTEGGASTLEIPQATASNSAWYQCMAQNSAGSTATRAKVSVAVEKQAASPPWRLQLPKPQKVIEPEPEPQPEIIYLRHVERARPQMKRADDEPMPTEPPRFVIPLKDCPNIQEGGRAIFEGKITPVGDPTMEVEWFFNGKPLEASSRITSTFRFGYITLSILTVTQNDVGVYTCRARNRLATAESSANLHVTARVTIESTSQHPQSMEEIQRLEDYSKYTRMVSEEETSTQKPVFIKPLRSLGDLHEGSYAHFEAQIQPVSDPYMKVDWFHNGKSLTASSRITTIFNFGYIALNIMHLRSEDTGTYTVRASNRAASVTSEATLQVVEKGGVISELGIPEQQRYIEKVQELESYHLASQQQRLEEEIAERFPVPVFNVTLKDQPNIPEGGVAHLEARLEPVGDPRLTVQWFKDGRPMEASSRITTFFNFGYVALTIKAITVHDMGVYTCRALNASGEAVTAANLSVLTKKDILSETQHPVGLEKIQYLEDASKYGRQIMEDVSYAQIPPKFLGPLKGTNKIIEGQNAHFETRLEPQNDPGLRVDWYCNGKPLTAANRIQTYNDFGYVAMDILSVRAEDSGNYTVVAKNALGEAQQLGNMQVHGRTGVDTTSMHKGGYEKTREREARPHEEPCYEIEEISKSKPIFSQPLGDHPPVPEGGNFHVECRLEPMGDPTMRVEWFLNGRSITVGSRFRTYFDFGYVALDVSSATVQDTGEYTVRATNNLGSAHTSTMIRVLGQRDVISETQHEAAMEQISMLEDSSRYNRDMQEDVTVTRAPAFVRSLHNIETVEGSNVHLECRVQPVGDSSMRVEWYANGKPIPVGHRFRPAYEFDYVALDILSAYAEDSGVYTCKARNAVGEAVTSASVKCINKKDLFLESQHPASLQQIQQLEDASRYQRKEWVEEVMKVQPRFLSEMKDHLHLREQQFAHLECRLEPVADPNLKVEWFKDGKPLTAGHRFRPIHDFGYVALDVIDLIAEDTGVYTCRATNMIGRDEKSARIQVIGGAQVVMETMNQEQLQKIQSLEDRSQSQRTEMQEELTTQPPVFTSSLKNMAIKEGQRAHFECRLIPVSDPTLVVEWFHNGQAVKSGSRFTESCNFGFTALDIFDCMPEDSGSYTCRARNALGEAVTSCSLVVEGRKSIYMETQSEAALEKIRQLEQYQQCRAPSMPDESTTQSPVFTQPLKNLEIRENEPAHFECRLIPVGDPNLRVEWFRNGMPMQQGSRVRTMHDFGFVALDLTYAYPEDSGTYTCKATNQLGTATTSGALVVRSKGSLLLESQNVGAMDKIRHLEDTSRYTKFVEEDVEVTSPPTFVTPLTGNTDMNEGASSHFECRIEPYPDPSMTVKWFLNGKPLNVGHRYRSMYDFGFAALDILDVYPEDSGEYTIKATNKLGTATSSVKLNVTPKGRLILDSQHPDAMPKLQQFEVDRHRRPTEEEAGIIDKPEFRRPLCSKENIIEGQPVHLEATLTPVHDPTMKVQWFCNGRPIQQGHRFKTHNEFGFVALDILYTYPEDSGTYMCKATNKNGEAVTSCAVTVQGLQSLYLDTMDADRLQKLKQLEAAAPPPREEEVAAARRPEFVTPLNSLDNLREGERAHLECRLEPINDPKLKVEWFVNGVQLKTGHRFRNVHDFGYVALDILYVYPEDSGTYMCKATNEMGEAVNTCTITVSSRKSIYVDSQHPEGWEKIREMESMARPGPAEMDDAPLTPPKFVTSLQGVNALQEGQNAHFECRVEPTHDPKLRLEVYHNGKLLPVGSRFHVTSDFGYVALDVMQVLPSDAGDYVIKAINDLGQDQASIHLSVEGKGGIICESQHPQGLDKIRELESMDRYARPDYDQVTTFQRPVFTSPLQNLDGLAEGQNAHLECRLIPVGDPTLKVEWFRNEMPIEPSSRIQKTHDFGYVALDISYLRPEDEGVYMCRASNNLGEAVTTASIKIKSKASIDMDSQHPQGLAKIRELESSRGSEMGPEKEVAFEKPVFVTPLTGQQELVEGQHAHFECRVVPIGDPDLSIEWYVNGVHLATGTRFRTTHDFGHVTLDINSVIPEDAGVYMCKAVNKVGEAITSTSIKIIARSSILGSSLHPKGWEAIQQREAEMGKPCEQFIELGPQAPPVFIENLTSHDKLVEGQNVRLEARVEPKNDPELKIEWYKNGVSLGSGSRMRTAIDFGLVTMDLIGVRPGDSGIYTCKATNKLGEAVSTCTLKVEGRSGIIGETFHPEAINKISELEALPEQRVAGAPEPDYEGPVFVTHLNKPDVKEEEAAHFECKVEPSKDPTLQVEFFINGKPLPTASRFTSKCEFGFITLDIQHCWPDDAGVYMCKATNAKGQAVTTGSLRVLSKSGIFMDTQHPTGKAGLDKIDDLERDLAEKMKPQDAGPRDEAQRKPEFIVPLNPQFLVEEGKALHLECQVEPKNDPKLSVEWFFNGKALDAGSRFLTRYDFGTVTLDILDAYQRDSGIYTSRAKNFVGEAFTSTTIVCTEKRGLIEDTQHPKGREGLEKIQNLEESLKRAQPTFAPEDEGKPPKFTSQFENLTNLSEGELAHFEASLAPAGDQTMFVEWFYNDKPLKAGHRVRTVHAFGMVVLEILGTTLADSGEYSCRATNKWGKDEISVTLGCITRHYGQGPKFTSQLKDVVGIRDNESAHFECTLVPIGDPDLKVEWFHNGQPLRQSNRIKTVADFGFVVLDVSSVQSQDAGEYVCKATNKFGTDSTKAVLHCLVKAGVMGDTLQPKALEKIRELEQLPAPQVPTTREQLEAPKFITQLVELPRVVEGQSAHFEAKLTPTNDPNLKVEWYHNGRVLRSGHRFRTFHDFGIVILDILYCYEEDSGEYECRAVNKLGQDSTRTTMTCISKASLIFDPQMPKDMKGGLEKIRDLEDAAKMGRFTKEAELTKQAPVFTKPLDNVEDLREGENAHFEAKLTPTDDPNLKIEWFKDDKPLKASSRIRTLCDFGFVILEMSPVYPEDSGVYSCRAKNNHGEAVTSAKLLCTGKRSIIFDSQLPRDMQKGMEKIAELEGLGYRVQDVETADEGQAPEFVSKPSDLTLGENSMAHFECQLKPVNDPSMSIEWYHNGKPLAAGSRIKTINDFGFVILELAGVYHRDSGLYVCKATNRHGEATASCQLVVKGRTGIILEPQLPKLFQTGTESIQKLEESLYSRREESLVEDEKPNPPRFVTEIEDIAEVLEGAPIHFDCRVEPVGDTTMRIEWFHNGRLLDAGSRIHMIDDFGFVVLDIDWTFPRDSGEYVCRATNKWGTTMTKARVTCKAKRGVIIESQLPSGMSAEKLKSFDEPATAPEPVQEIPAGPPKFVQHISNVEVAEGEKCVFECRVEPINDPKLRVEWYRNGKIVQTGHRFKTTFDFGYVSLEILYTYAEDSGEYICRAVNDYGEDFTKAFITCKAFASIVLLSQLPKGMKKSETLVQMEAALKKYTSDIVLTEEDIYDAEKNQPPRFVTQIQSQLELKEMDSTKFECQLAPVGDPNMKVEWFLNGKPLPFKTRFTPIYDFGYVAVNFGWVYPQDSGEYLCRATNLYGSDETSAIIKTAGKPGIIYDSQLPAGMQSVKKIQEMEAAWQRPPDEPEDVPRQKEAPQFVLKPEPYSVDEGDWARFVCRVTGYPRPRVMWLVNGHTIMNGTRYKLTYDGMWHLDIPKTRQYDQGTVQVIAKNALGEAVTSTLLTVKPKMDDYRAVLKNSPRPWYDYDLRGYQVERQECELDRAFEERVNTNLSVLHHSEKSTGEHLATKVIREPETEWQQAVKRKKNDGYYTHYKQLEDDQVLKEARMRGDRHPFAIPGQQPSLARGMASSYETKLSEEKLQQQRSAMTDEMSLQEGSVTGESEVQLVRRVPDPSESSVHGKEIYTNVQKQTQKEVKGNQEITRKITATETTEVEHKAKTQERVVQGPVKPAKPPAFTKKIQPCRAFEKEQARFEVEFDGDPMPQIKWFREDFPIQNSPELQIHTFGTKSILVVREVFMEDSGVFAVIAENRGGTAKCSANLVVEEKKPRKSAAPPSFATTIQDATVQLAQLARFDARITGSQPIDVYWLKNGKKFGHDVRYKMLEEDGIQTLLILETVGEDAGLYECVAINENGEARCEAKLQVISTPVTKAKQPAPPGVAAKAAAPVIKEKLKASIVEEGQPATFRCKLTGSPAPRVAWMKGSKIIKPSKYFRMSHDSETYSLHISEAFPEDEGVYKCVAENQSGTAASEAQLKVTAPSSEGSKPPTLTAMKDVVCTEGQPGTFVTQVGGTPTPSVQWFREGTQIPQSADFEMYQEGNKAILQIKVTYPEDSGRFTCRATNSVGQAETSAMLTADSKQ